MNQVEEKNYLSIGLWLRETYRLAVINFSASLPALVLFVFPSAILLGVSLWYAFESVEVVWDPDNFSLSSSGFELSFSFFGFLASIALSYAGLMFLTVLHLKVLELRKNDSEEDEQTRVPDSFVFDSLKKMPKFFLVGSINLLVIYICFFSPNLLRSLNLSDGALALVGLSQLALILFGLLLILVLVFWPIETFEESQSFVNALTASARLTFNNFFKVLGRALILVSICYITFVAFSTLGDIVLSIFGLNPESTQEITLEGGWSTSLRLLIGETPAVAALKIVFNFLGLAIASMMWLSGLKLLHTALTNRLDA